MDSFRVSECYTTRKGIRGPKNALQRVIFTLTLFVMLIPFVMTIPVLAANITDATYGGTILIVNNDTCTNYNVTVNFTLSTEDLITDDYSVDNCSNTAVLTGSGADVAYMPGMGNTTKWVLFVPSIEPGEALNYKFYSGGDQSMASPIYYFPGNNAGLGTTDTPALELGNNFTIEQGVRFDPNAIGTNLTNKPDAFRLYVSDNNTITVAIEMSVNTTPTGHDDPDSGWGSETNAYDNNINSYATTSAGGDNWSTYIILTHNSVSCTGIQFYAQWVATEFNKIWVDTYYNNGWQHVYDGNFTDLGWDSYSLNGTYTVNMSRVRFFNDNAAERLNKDTLREFDFITIVTATATDVGDGEHVINATADGTNLTLYVDGVEKDSSSLSGVSVPDNSNNWAVAHNGSTKYLLYHKVYINGTLQQYLQWENNSTTFTDLSGHGHNATVSFNTTGSHSNVTAALITFGPLSSQELVGYSVESDTSMFDSPPDEPDNLYGEGNTNHIPGASLINNALDQGGIPQDLFWFPFTFGISALLGMVIFGFTNSLLTQAIVSGFIMFFFAMTGGGVIPLWSPIVFVIEAVGIIIARKQVSW